MLARALRESVPSEVRAVFDRARVAIDNHVRQALEADKADRLLRDTTEVRSPGSYKSVESYKSRMPSIKAILDGAPHFRRQVRYLELEALTVLEAEKRVASILAKMPQLKIDSMRWSERSKTFIAA
jgi:hypothetical protein